MLISYMQHVLEIATVYRYVEGALNRSCTKSILRKITLLNSDTNGSDALKVQW